MRASTPIIILSLLGLASHLATGQWTRCTRDCMTGWCNEICGHGDGTDIRCANACMDDCDRACEVCKTQPDCVYYTPTPPTPTPKKQKKKQQRGLEGGGRGLNMDGKGNGEGNGEDKGNKFT
ncbi:hypothetical protein QBC42DRAFT_248957 [Cladorrhinum samala]|uniref:Uncharacterized protein n=1 Tax=Cladorrhinum samala TaxID=585594 RepID=A0AAV9HXR2_9PEZI|nr:hypothetical protein QBC42DRAFT_248957 [Cladorrhinum samala]